MPPPSLPPTMPFLESDESGNTEESIPDVCFPSNSVQLLLWNNPLLSVRFEPNPWSPPPATPLKGDIPSRMQTAGYSWAQPTGDIKEGKLSGIFSPIRTHLNRNAGKRRVENVCVWGDYKFGQIL